MSQATNKPKDIPQDIPNKDLWDAFQGSEVAAVFREEFAQRYNLAEFMEYHGLHRTRDMLALVIESRQQLRAAWESPEGGAE